MAADTGEVLRGSADWAHLKAELDGFLQGVDWETERDNDPISLPWGYDDPTDREVAALVAATLAYGQVRLLKQAIARALAPLGPHPALTLRAFDEDKLAEALGGFVYRMTRGEDLLALYRAIGHTLREEGSLGALFKLGFSNEDEDFQSALAAFVATLRARGQSDRRGFHYLLSDPARGGACKRLNLFLRWMVRGPDAIDLGLWSELPADRLVMPLDTHIVRICTYLGLATRKTQDWRLAREIADNLKRLDPHDPLKYDFAVCHLGISGACPRRRELEKCQACPIQAVCLLA